jgi:peptidoglycan/xylan/chitin deacetylase (PgdA/CDA1 family)
MLRYRAAEFFDRARIPRVLLSLRRMTGVSPWITILTYHRVAPASAAGDFEDGTVDVTPEAFDVHLAFAKQWFDIIGMDDLLAFARGGSLPPNPILFTFDDGYRDNLTTALPLLQKHGARATFFISTTYVGERRLFWWDRLSYMVKRSTRERIEIQYPAPAAFPLTSAVERRRAFCGLRRFLTEHVGIDLWRFLDEVAEATGVTLSREDERRFAADMILTWDDVKALRAAGMDIQSHTCDHYILSTLRAAGLRTQLAKSREILEGVLKEPVRALSYPVGRGVVTEEIRAEMKRAGYELGFTNASGINHRRDFDPLAVHRIALDIDSPNSYFRSVMAVPYLST